MLSRVYPDALEFVWPQIEPKVLKSLEHGAGDSLSIEKIKTAILSGDMELWAVHEDRDVSAGIILQALQRDKGIALYVVLVAGEGWTKSASQVNQKLKEYAQEIGAYTVEATCRKGMARWLEELGWKEKAILMEMNNG